MSPTTLQFCEKIKMAYIDCLRTKKDKKKKKKKNGLETLDNRFGNIMKSTEKWVQNTYS